MHKESSDNYHQKDIIIGETKNDLLSQVSEVIWRVLVGFCFSLTLVAIVSLLLRIPISKIYFLIGLLLCIIFVALTHFKTSKKIFIASCLLAVFIIFLVIKISEPLLDFSYDGRCYHYLAIHSIQAGWNPLYDPFPNSWPQYQAPCATWSMLYPKGYWYAGAILEKFFANFETAKSINLLWGMSVFFLSFSKLRFARLQAVYKVLISTAIILNPVALSQLFTNYVDGQLYYCQVIIIILLISQIINKNASEFFYLGFAIIYLINLKYTGLLYSIIYLGSAFLYIWLGQRELKKTIPLVITSAISIFIAFFLMGYNPYLTNYIKYKDPLYPWGFMANDSHLNIEQMLEVNRPADFNQLNRFQRLARAIFSTSSLDISSSELKIPFSIELKEIPEYMSPDIRLGGFGPWFSGAFVVSAIMLVIILIFLKDRRNFTLLFTVVVLLSVLITEDGWWARYAPQLWLIPIFFSIPLLEKSDKLVFQGISIILLFIILFNSYLTSVSNLSGIINASLTTKSDISEILSTNKRIKVRFNDMLSFEEMMNRYHIKYSVLQDGASFPCPANYIYGLEYSLAKCKVKFP